MLGKPKFNIGDKVVFNIITETDREIELVGEVFIVDRYGTFFDDTDVCYDIMTSFDGEDVLIKHINECGVKRWTE